MSNEDNLPYLHIAETILQESLSPSSCALSTLNSFSKEPRVDIRNFAYQVVIDAVQKVRGNRLTTDTVLNESEVTQIREEMGAHLGTLSRQVAIANNIALVDFAPSSTPMRHHARTAFQNSMLEIFQAHAQTLPLRNAHAHGHPITERLRDGLLGVAPTGSGKTVIAAKSLRALGIGTPANIDGQPLRALVVLPDQNLLTQFSGAQGDDTFRRFLGRDVPITSFWEKEKDTSGAIVLTTRQSLPKAIADGQIAPDSFDIALFDEAHHGLGQVMKAHLGKLGIRLFCLTATPAYTTERDLRQLFSHVEIGSLYSFVREGILNPVRLYTYRSKDNNEAQIAAGLASTYIKEGRKVVVYCRSGGQSEEAKQVAKLINAQTDVTTAQAIGSFEPNASIEHQEQFHAGNVRCLTTVAMLREGWNADVDVVIVIGSNSSLLDLTQKVGRAMRPGELDTIVAEILPLPQSGARPMHSIWNVFGLEDVVQGQLLSTEHAPQEPQSDEDGTFTDFPQEYQRQRQSYSTGKMQRFPKIVQTALAPDRPLREILIAPEDLARQTPPEHYVEIGALAAEHSVPMKWLQMKLDKADIRYVGIWREGKKTQFERWYDPAALDYLRENPVPKMADETTFHTKAISDLCGISIEGTQAIIVRLGVVGEERLGKAGRATMHYSLEQLALVLEEVNSIPVASETDVIYNEILKQLGHSFVERWCAENKITPTEKRRHHAHGIKGVAGHVTQEEAQRITEARLSIPTVDANFMSIIAIAKSADVKAATIRASFTPEEEAQLCFARQVGARVHLIEGLPRDIGEAMANRLRPQPLPPYAVPLGLIAKRTGKFRAPIANWMSKNGFSKHTLRVAGAPNLVSCYDWEATEAFEKHFGLSDGHTPLNAALLVRAADETDQKKWEYVQKIQSCYIDAKFLPPLPRLPSPDPTSPSPYDTEDPPEYTAQNGVRLADLIAELNCTTGAMQWALQHADIAETELFAMDGSPRKTHITWDAAEKIREYCAQKTTVVLTSSIPHSRVAAATGLTTTEIFNFISHNPAATDSVRLRREAVNSQIDLYYNDNLARRLLAAAKTKNRKT